MNMNEAMPQSPEGVGEVTEEQHVAEQEKMEAQGSEPGQVGNPDLMKKWEEEKGKPSSPHGETSRNS